MKPLGTIYRAVRLDDEGVIVSRIVSTTDAERLLPADSLCLANHSPSGFEFGFGGSGPAQLALAILLDFTESPELALERYQAFKWRHVASWQGNRATITGLEISEFVQDEAFDPVEPMRLLLSGE